MKNLTSSLSINLSIDRRDFIKLVAGSTILATGALTMLNQLPFSRILPEGIIRAAGETAVPIPDSWYRVLERVSIDSVALNKTQIDSLPMPKVDYQRVCNCNPNNFIHTTKYGVALPAAFEKLGMNYNNREGQLMIAATDWYAVVPSEPDKTFFSASKDNIPKELWGGLGLNVAKEAKMTPYATFNPSGKDKGEAWKDLVDVNNVGFQKQELKPGAYFLGPTNQVIIPENKDIGMGLDNLFIKITDRNHYVDIPYSKIRLMAEKNWITYEKEEFPYIKLKDLVKLADVNPNGIGLVLHANNYAASIPPWRQDKLGIIFDQRYEKKYGVPTKLIGGELLNKAAQIGGLYRIDTFQA